MIIATTGNMMLSFEVAWSPDRINIHVIESISNDSQASCLTPTLQGGWCSVVHLSLNPQTPDGLSRQRHSQILVEESEWLSLTWPGNSALHKRSELFDQRGVGYNDRSLKLTVYNLCISRTFWKYHEKKPSFGNSNTGLSVHCFQRDNRPEANLVDNPN